jgi:predicted GNAT family acetyltransferase
MPPPTPELTVGHQLAEHRFELILEGQVAYLSYTPAGDRMVFDHTYVPEPLRGKGLAAILVRQGLEEARKQNWRVIPSCSYVASFVRRHPEFADLVDPR